MLATLAQACRDDERVGFGYRTRDGDDMARSVEPHRLVSVGRRWYLVGWDLTRHDWRSFRLDRMSEAATTGVRFRQRELPGGDAAEFVKGGLRNLPQRHHVSVLVHTDADAVRRRVGRWGEVEELGEDALPAHHAGRRPGLADVRAGRAGGAASTSRDPPSWSSAHGGRRRRCSAARPRRSRLSAQALARRVVDDVGLHPVDDRRWSGHRG